MLRKVVGLLHPQGPFLAGPVISWADLFMFPILADLKSIPVTSRAIIVCLSIIRTHQTHRKAHPYEEG